VAECSSPVEPLDAAGDASVNWLAPEPSRGPLSVLILSDQSSLMGLVGRVLVAFLVELNAVRVLQIHIPPVATWKWPCQVPRPGIIPNNPLPLVHWLCLASQLPNAGAHKGNKTP